MRKIVECRLTPEELAHEFWKLDSHEQATFFKKLSQCGESFDRQMQWWYLHNDVKDKETKECIMDIAAPFYLHTLRQMGIM